ncbi:hypothetical protein J7394_20985 [Ruegeria sp. R13_0]|nr:hypothetical protein [Ruegeria sp. R13_0]MBO9436693.1 hypothetical protein [Ruegeria sp. R13_0]
MIRDIVAVAVHRPEEVFLKPMRMAMVLDHFQMVLDRLKYRRCVRE